MTRHTLGKYRLLAELGHGGMADVFLALVEGPAGLGFAKLAVVKRLRAELADDPEFVTMLIDEARISARLNHPNVVQVLDVGQVDEQYYLAMEYLDGQPLHRIERRMARSGIEISKSAKISVLVDVLSGLHHAHELLDYDGSRLDVIHRDVTPHNIFVTYDGQVKVMDFGIAKAAGRAQETKHGIVKGKTRFMSPEQAMGQPVDCRADIFAVGILLWQAATGEHFWGELDDLAIVETLISGRYSTSPRARCPDVPEELDRICQRALSPRIEERYASALEMQTAIEAFLGADALSGRRELVNLLNEHFAKERAQLRAIVEKANKRTLSGPSVRVLNSRSTSSTGSVTIPPITTSVAPDASNIKVVTLSPPPHRAVAVADATPAAVSAPPPPTPPPPTGRAIFASALGAAALTVLGIAFVGSLKEDRAPRPRPTAATVVSDFVRFNESTRVRSPQPSMMPQFVLPYGPRALSYAAGAIATEPAERPVAPAPPPTPPAMARPATTHSPGLVRRLDSADPWDP